MGVTRNSGLLSSVQNPPERGGEGIHVSCGIPSMSGHDRSRKLRVPEEVLRQRHRVRIYAPDPGNHVPSPSVGDWTADPTQHGGFHGAQEVRSRNTTATQSNPDWRGERPHFLRMMSNS